MKKIINVFVITILLTSFISCSSNEDNQESELKYSAQLEEVCREDGNYYCITKQEFERVKEIQNTPPFEACEWVSIKDINGNKYSGYLRSLGASLKNSICN